MRKNKNNVILMADFDGTSTKMAMPVYKVLAFAGEEPGACFNAPRVKELMEIRNLDILTAYLLTL